MKICLLTLLVFIFWHLRNSEKKGSIIFWHLRNSEKRGSIIYAIFLNCQQGIFLIKAERSMSYVYNYIFVSSFYLSVNHRHYYILVYSQSYRWIFVWYSWCYNCCQQKSQSSRVHNTWLFSHNQRKSSSWYQHQCPGLSKRWW